jgi:RimJ/RimL family protein N-acetyltransferase
MQIRPDTRGRMPQQPPTASALPTTVTLRGGRKVNLHETRPQDIPALLDAFHHLCADAVYTRFMAALREPPRDLVDAILHPHPEREFALVASSADGGAECIVGSARIVGAPESDTCEFSVAVADDWHGTGLARLLLEFLIDAAPGHQFRRMEGYVLATNTPMRRLAKKLGFADEKSEDDPTLRVMSLSLAPP